ncbi:MAG: hypothetical protein Q7S58_10460 [Candidatus Binatus sp.]|uniref:hypothetical protein n=1 Tax=Candidatus Binatus sp. TaxID=2811406 RepID=UPI0027261BB3|nr:hypothetical protein [Candidatus Binatus sp.]MDO8432815.1 hypothetical protein [Candidatus Binatus sp.]
MQLASSSVNPLLRIPFWLASFSAIILSFTGQVTSSLMGVYDPEWRDSTVKTSGAEIAMVKGGSGAPFVAMSEVPRVAC